MSSARVWVPAERYDSVKPLWKDHYVWCPLPVDNSLPLHQTSYLDIDEKEAVAARSRGNTIVSQPKASPVDADSTAARSSSDQEEGWPAQETMPSDSDIGDQALETTRQLLPNPRARAQVRDSAAELMSPRPDYLKETRLHSFHLMSKRDMVHVPGIPKSPIQSPRKSQSRERKKEKQNEDHFEKTRRTDISARLKELDDLPPGQVTRKRRRAAWPPRQKTGRSRTGPVPSPALDGRQDPSKPTQKSPLRKPLAPVDPKTISQAKHTSSLCLKVDLNLEVEVQLKARILGDLTLTLYT